MDWAYGDLMDSIAFDGDEGVGLGDDGKLLASVRIAAEREEGLGPAAVAQPVARVRFAARDSQQVVHCPLHARRGRKEARDTRIKRCRCFRNQVFHDDNCVGEKIRCGDAKTEVAITIVRSP